MLSSTTAVPPPKRMSLLSLHRWVWVSILCIPCISHVCSFQSMYTAPIMLPPTRTDVSTRRRTITRFSSLVSPLKLASSSGDSNSASSKPKQSYSSTIQWEKKFDLLCQYKEREGHVDVLVKHEEDGEKLGAWLYRQRKSYKAGKLQAERQRKLESLGVQLDGPTPKEKELNMEWERIFNLLSAFKEREGHADVPQKFKTEDGTGLGVWLNLQRINQRKGTLRADRKRKLESIGVQFDGLAALEKRREMEWERRFDLLSAIKEWEGDANVSKYYIAEDGTNIGQWLADQRRDEKFDILKEERFEKLDSLGVRWSEKPVARRPGVWEEKFALLSAFKERNGHIDLPNSYEVDGIKLGRWLATQRQMYRQWTLDRERERKLESLGIQWNADPLYEERLEAQWETMFALLSVYKEREGDANVSKYYIEEDGTQLGQWLSDQRRLKRPIKADRREKLVSLGVQFDQLVAARSDKKWEKKFDLLCQYKEREGHADVPRKHKENGENLGIWLNTQRTTYKAGKLLPERKTKLDSVGVNWRAR